MLEYDHQFLGELALLDPLIKMIITQSQWHIIILAWNKMQWLLTCTAHQIGKLRYYKWHYV